MASTLDVPGTTKPCPFCGGTLDITKHFRENIWRGIHRCKVVGAISFEWTDDIQCIISKWNTRV